MSIEGHGPRPALANSEVRAADQVYKKLLVRVIDVREKQNLPLKWPVNPLSEIIRHAATEPLSAGEARLLVYRDEYFSSSYTVEEAAALGGRVENIGYQPYADEPDYIIDTQVTTQFDYSTIQRWMIGEEWVFDKQRGTMAPRILWIAPMYRPALGMVELDEMPMYYIPWPAVEKLLAGNKIFNPRNDASTITYKDFFAQRLFSSLVAAEENVFDLSIRDQPEFNADPLGALYEGEAIASRLRSWEQDIWEH